MVENVVLSAQEVSFMTWIAFVPGVVISLILFYGAYNILLHPLRSYPGPKLWAAYRLTWIRSLLSGRYPFDVLELHKKYGPVVRVAPDELSYADSAAWKTICGHHNSVTEGFSEFPKDMAIFAKPSNGVQSIVAVDQITHARFRRLLSHSFSDKGLRVMQPRIQHLVDMLIRRLHERCGEGYLDMVQWYNWATLDVVRDLSFGESSHCLENQRSDGWIAALFGNVKVTAFAGALLRYKLGFLLRVLVPRSLMQLRDRNEQLEIAQIDRRIQQGTDQGDFWDNVIKKSDFEQGTGMTREEMVSNAGLLVLAGSETTATVLSGTTYLLIKNPRVMAKLLHEVRGAFTSESDIDLISVNKLEYMLAVLDEAMRLYPPSAQQGSRVVPAPGAMVCGKWVPGRTAVQVQRYAINRLSSNFHRPLEFIPERWLPNPPSEFANDDRSAPQSFSLGPRNCIGRNLAYAEMRLILAKVCWNFNLKLDESRCEEWMESQKVFFLWEKVPLWVKLEPFTK